MKLFNKIKNKLGMLALFGLLFQLTMPVYQTYVFATDNGMGVTEQLADQKVDEAGEDGVVEEPVEEEPDTTEEPEAEDELNELTVDPVSEDSEDEGKMPIEGEAPEELVDETPLEGETEVKENSDGEQITSEDGGKPEKLDDKLLDRVTYSQVPEEITTNIIDLDSIKLLYEDGSEVGPDDVVDPNENLSFHLAWKLPDSHGYKDGAYFKFQLPEQLKIYKRIDKKLSECASFVVETNGEVTFTFNENIENFTNIKGTFGVETVLEAIENESMEETLEVKINEEVSKKIKINVKPTGGKIIKKTGKTVGNEFNAKKIQWTVDINTKRDSLKSVVIEDTLSEDEGQEWILDGAGNIVYELHEIEVNNKGEFVKTLEPVESSSIKQESLEIKLGDTNKAYRLTFKTQFTESEQGAEGTKKYSNEVFLTSTDTEKVGDEAEVSVTRPESLQKTASKFKTGDRSVNWTVNANFTEQSLVAGDKIVDEFTFKAGNKVLNDIFEIENIEIKQVEGFDSEGKITGLSEADNMFKEPIIDNNKVTFTLKEDTDKAFVITYQTVAKDGKIINDNGKITNKVTLTGQTKSVKQTVNVQQQVLKKSHSKINYKDKTIDWTITVNADKQKLKNFKLTDNFSGSGQQLVDNSLIVEPTIDSSAVDSTNEGFEIDFGTITDTYTIKYTTKFTYDFSGTERPNFKNNAEVRYDVGDLDNPYTQTIDKTPTPNTITKNNGAKSGKADNDTKRITWTIDVNYNQLTLANAKLIDIIEANQSLVPKSVKVYKTNIADDGKITAVVDSTGNPVDTENISVEMSTIKVEEKDRDQIIVDFGDEITDSYRITFETTDKDGIYNKSDTGKAYINTATFSSDDRQPQDLQASTEFAHQGKFLSKGGEQNFEDWTIDWEVIVNKSRSKLNNVVVKDTLGKGQVLLTDTISITNLQSNSELVQDTDYKLVLNGNELTIKFIDSNGNPYEITDDYKVTYSSYITEETHNSEIKNEAKVTSNTPVKGETGKDESVQFKTSSGYGTAQGEVYTGNLQIKKTEKDSNRLLSGVSFKLVKKFTSGQEIQEIIVREGETDSKGELEWKNIAYGTYTLKETIPTGYEGEGGISTQDVEIAGENEDGQEYEKRLQILPVENTRKTGQAKIIKVDAHTKETIKGAKFKLENQTTGQVYEFETDTDGGISEVVPFGEYTVEEITAPAGYRITKDIPNVTVEIGKEATVTVENVAYVDIPVQKTWYVDEGQQLPDSVTVNLLRNGEATDRSITLNAANEWKNSFKNLDKYTEAKREIKYTIEEVVEDGYIVEQDGYNLTNIQSTDISVKKNWVDDNNPDRPTSVNVQLYADDKALAGKVVTLSSDADDVTKDWAHTFTDLPMYSKKGEKINYTVKEVETPKNYESSVEDYEITNLRKAKTSVSGEKTWKDEDPTDRPKEIKVNLTRTLKGEVDADFTETLTVKPNAKGEWKYTFDELDQFDEQGVEYTYIVEEDEVPETYKSTVDGYDITNVRVGKTEVAGTKRWKDDKVDDRPVLITVNLLRNNVVIDSIDVTAADNWKYSFTELDKYDDEGKYYNYTVKEEQVPGYAPEVTGDDITNTRSAKTNFEITKGWLDDDSENRPDSIMVYIYQNDKLFDTVKVTASEEWVYEVTDIEAYDEDGQPYTYTIKEKPLTENDSVDQYQTTVNGFNITNLRVGETEVIGEKIWEEVDSQYRPDSITINLLANGEIEDSITVSGKTNWKYAFKELAKYDDQGKEINYTVTEDDVPAGYESAVEGDNIINKQISTEVTGKKVWLDDNNPERPDSIKVHLLANGEETDHSLEVSGETDWNYRFTDLPKFDKAGKEIKYSVKEEAVKGYDTAIDGFVITKLRVGEMEVSGEKIWKDAGPADRPESIDVILTRNVKGELDTDFEQERTVTPDSDGKWFYTFDRLSEFDEKGQAYTYTVKEETTPAGYESSVDGYDITNLRVGTVSLSGVKTWKDDNISDRPNLITVNLLRNNVVIDTKEVQPEDPADEWAYTFSELAEFDEEGIPYEYRVSEEDVPGYAAEFTGMNITNTRSEKKTIEITKGWLDDSSKDRPKSIEVDVYQNDELFKTVKVKASEGWTYELQDLEAYDEEGQAYTYTIEERAIKGYETKVDGFNLTNTRTGILSVEGEKFWKDEGIVDRPESIEISLTRELKGEADESFTMTQTVTPDATGKWMYAFEELSAFNDQGVAYDYQVKENAVPAGYKTSVDGYDITNLRVGMIDLMVEKKWMNDTETNRPEKIIVDLMQNGKLFESLMLSKATGWTHTFTDLDEFDQEGKAYEYTIEEGPVEGYETSIEETKQGFTLINTFNTPETPEEPEEPGKPDLPKTGESNNSVLYLVGGMLVLVGLVIGRKRLEE